ncbi:MAG TPA: hypothetical protein VIF57_02205 [Polyangia bacterium]|jgi:hypothetical protein
MSTLLASRVARRVGWIVGLIVGTIAGCCGGQSTLLCQANGTGTRWACGASADCPRNAQDCASVARLDDGRDFNVCVPAAAP